MPKPIIYLAFANDKDEHLGLLDNERQEIVRALLPLRDVNRLTIMEEAAANKKILSYYLSKYSNRIEIFHYAGHAEEGALRLADSPAMARGLAEMLGGLPNLKLAFLNGCCTNSLLQMFHDHGVKAVIGTSVPVRDSTAADFSVQFYQSLAEGKTIQEAFNFARGLVHTSHDNINISVRGLELPAAVNGAFAWGLYKSDDSVLTYALPEQPFRDAFPVLEDHVDTSNRAVINSILREKMLGSLHSFSDDLGNAKRELDKGIKVEDRKIHRYIRDALPAPLGIELNRIFGSARVTRGRLQAFVDVYRTLMQLITFILYSQLWDFMHENRNDILDSEMKNDIIKLLSKSKSEQSYHSFIKVIQGIREFLEINNKTLFVLELNELASEFRNNDIFRIAHKRMEDLRVALSSNNDISPGDLLDLNEQAESDIGDIFSFMGFACRYKFVAIKDIDLIKRRHMPPEYRIVRVNLDSVSAGLSEDTGDFKGFADIQSIVLLRERNIIEDNLNLSPFLFDENAMLERRETARLFILSHYDFDRQQLYYNFLEDPQGYTNVDARIEGELHALFSRFIQTILRS